MLSLLGGGTFLEAYAGVLNGQDILDHCRQQHAPEIYRTWLKNPVARVWVAETKSGNAPIAYAVLDQSELDFPESSPNDFEVKRLYVFHRFKGTGIGAALLKTASSYAYRLGAQRLVLGVYSRNLEAIGFYTKVGFSPCGERQFKVGSSVNDDFILSKLL